MIDLTKQNTETELQYIWRLGSAKDSGLLDFKWSDLADIMNANLGPDRSYNECTYRKKYALAKQMYDEVFSKFDNVSRDMDSKIRELERAKIMYRDERNAWQKQNYLAAIVENRLDILETILSENGKKMFAEKKIKERTIGDTDLIVCLSDMHIGSTFQSAFGSYNTNIATSRLREYLEEVIKIGKRHNAKKVWVSLLGDQINGNIHFTTQVANNENIIEQVKIASQLISEFCVELSYEFEDVMVIGASGNHSRMVSNKEFAVHDERLDDLITWIVQGLTQHIKNIHILERNIDSGIFDISVHGKTYIGIHGDFDLNGKSSLNNLVSMLGFFPYAVIAGHNHFPAYSERNGIRLVQCGCLCGSGDDYTVEKRLFGHANQTVLVCNPAGIECIYNVQLDGNHFRLGVK